MSNWYFSDDGRAIGPLSFEALKQLAAAGRLNRTDRVLQGVGGAWMLAEQAPGLFPEASITASYPALRASASPIKNDSSSLEPSYWLMLGSVPQGPFPLDRLRAMFAVGTVGAEAKACLVGSDHWRDLGGIISDEAMASRLSQSPPLPRKEECDRTLPYSASGPPVSLPKTATSTAPSANMTASEAIWHPVAIGVLGVFLSPLWAGVMASINAQRLGSTPVFWRAGAIGGGAFLADLILHRIAPTLWGSLALFIGSLILIWSADLQAQWEMYVSQRQQGRRRAGLLAPAAAGIALVIGSIAANDLLYPPGPRDICERFAEADRVGRKAICSKTLWPLMDADLLFNVPLDFQFLNETLASPHIGGRLVAFKRDFLDQGIIRTEEGHFHLVQVSGDWRLQEIYLSHDGFQPFAAPVALGAGALGQVAPGMNVGGDLRANPVPAKAEKNPSDHLWWKAPHAVHGIAALLGKMKVPGVIAVMIGAIFTWLRQTVAPPAAAESQSTTAKR